MRWIRLAAPVALIMTSSILAGCGNLSPTPDAGATHSHQSAHAKSTVTKTKGILGNYYKKSLVPVHYTNTQINLIKRESIAAHLPLAFVPRGIQGNGGVFRLLGIERQNFVMVLRFEDFTFWETRHFVGFASILKDGKTNPRLIQNSTFEDSQGNRCQWWEAFYPYHVTTSMLSVRLRHTWVMIIPNPAQAVDKPLTQAIAESLIPVTSFKK